MLELDSFYDKSYKCWVLIIIDENGNQIGDCEYYANKEQLQFALNNF
jgi:hypothetical protein